jgi:hypothetical protein
MKPLSYLATIVALCCAAAAAFAAELTPAGTWKWTIQGRQGGQGFEQTLKLDYKDGKLTGLLLGMQGGPYQVPDTAISDAVFQEGAIKFAVTRELNGNKFTTKYQGKLVGEVIKGTYERPGFNGGDPVTREWEAKRVAK